MRFSRVHSTARLRDIEKGRCPSSNHSPFFLRSKRGDADALGLPSGIFPRPRCGSHCQLLATSSSSLGRKSCKKMEAAPKPPAASCQWLLATGYWLPATASDSYSYQLPARGARIANREWGEAGQGRGLIAGFARGRHTRAPSLRLSCLYI
jgi:hypothetical protein